MAEASERLEVSMRSRLAVECIDTDVYRSAGELWKPAFGRAVFGGQVFAQACVCACLSVDTATYALHSCHSYFVLPGDPEAPIAYRVRRIRDGATYVTRTVTARQRGQVIFACMCSFARVSELSNAEHAFQMPEPATRPDDLPNEGDRLLAILSDPRLPESYHDRVRLAMKQSSAIDVRYCRKPADPLQPIPLPPYQCAWMRTAVPLLDTDSAAPATAVPIPPSCIHQCAIAYASDFALLSTSVLPYGHPNPYTRMMATIDHTVWFHKPSGFRADQWLLYEMESPRMISGRGLCTGRIFGPDGSMIASVAQEGVVRFDKTVDLLPALSYIRPHPPFRLQGAAEDAECTSEHAIVSRESGRDAHAKPEVHADRLEAAPYPRL